MIYPLNQPLMELLVLSMIQKEDSYGYQISQQLKEVSDMKDSALYPVLRRLSENTFVEIYDQQFQGRNRKYYRITESGQNHAALLKKEWERYVDAINKFVNREDFNREEAENE